MAEMIILKCEGCDKDFERLLSKHKESIQRGVRIFCGRHCFHSNKKQSKPKPKLKIKCDFCEKEFEKHESQIKLTKNHFCSQKCKSKFNIGKQISERIEMPCKNCDKQISISIKKYEWKITYKNQKELCWYEHYRNNIVKNIQPICLQTAWKPGNKIRSSFEIFCEEQIKTYFPTLFVEYNKSINYHSFDTYIPSLNLIFEFNGPCHYLPLYGENHLKYVQTRDAQKLKICENNKIEIEFIKMIEDVRSKKKKNEYWLLIKSLIENRIMI